MSGTVHPLKDNQLKAANPDGNVWLSASAGTGKTQVLSARVLRLLLTPGVEPGQILCLTFTKAGAAEMSNRINSVLARWVRLDGGRLGNELENLGANYDPETQDRARTLFASVLDCPGGGLRIDTIHAFSQWLLANFPEEADLTPGTRPMEDRERELLAREVLADLLDDDRDPVAAQIAGSASMFALEKGPEALRKWLMRCADAADVWEGRDGWKPPMRGRVHRLLGIPADADEAWAAGALHPDIFPDDQLRTIMPLMQDWNANAGRDAAEFIPEWLASPPDDRADLVGRFCSTLLTAKKQPRQMKKPAQSDPALPDRLQEIADAIAEYDQRCCLLEIVDFIVPALELGQAFALRWEKAKAREGLLDFSDLIRKAAHLLGNGDASAWIRFKLDRNFDHVLIDEAQDTNATQWEIVFALIDDYFSGDGARSDRLRTIFTVGDYKQAIFGFQGTSPDNFEAAKVKVRARIDEMREQGEKSRQNRRLPGWADLDLGRSYRTALPVLDFVNRAIAEIGHEAFGLPKSPEPHVGADRAGSITLLQPVVSPRNVEDEEDEKSERDASDDDGEQDWLPAHETLLAERIAEQVRRWVSGDEPFVLEKDKDADGRGRHAGAGDVMILVQKRRELASQIVGKLYAKGVPVAGVDRMRLGNPLAVKDLMAGLRFAAQPLDDLSLANLLSSPIIGWSQDDLLEFVPRPGAARLWHHLRASDHPKVVETVEMLRDLLARADYQTPQAMLAWMLTGPWRARRQLAARLGPEANDPIDELVNAAFAYESAHTPSLAGFIEWFDAGQSELKRDPDAAADQVRVMTVHGSKGLEAPIVILADATIEPSGRDELDLPFDPIGIERGDGERPLRRVPLPPIVKVRRIGPVGVASKAAEEAAMQEHYRLLYVAMTRAEEALFIAGSLGPRALKSGMPENSWYARLKPLFDTPEVEDPVWGARWELGRRADPLGDTDRRSKGRDRSPSAGSAKQDLPVWADTAIGPEPRPPRPLAPSAAGRDDSAAPPIAAKTGADGNADGDAIDRAARRGILIHRLLERLPDVPVDMRQDTAREWIERQADEFSDHEREEIVVSALSVLDTPEFSEIFAPGSLAEVPLAATVGDIVIAGTADRLLVTDNCVTVLDFKTTRRPPASPGAIPSVSVRQMAAYVAVLERIYPGRTIRAAILYTHTPILFTLPDETIALHKARLGEAQESFAPLRIE